MRRPPVSLHIDRRNPAEISGKGAGEV